MSPKRKKAWLLNAKPVKRSEASGPIRRKPRKQAPDLSIIEEVYHDEAKFIVEDTKKILSDKADGKHFCYRLPPEKESVATKKRLGYEMVHIDGEVITHKQDVLCMIDEDKVERQHNAAAMLSEAWLADVDEANQEERVTVDADGGEHKPEILGD